MQFMMIVGAALSTGAQGHPASDAGTAWNTAGMTVERPALSFLSGSRPALVMTCHDTSIQVQVRGFVAAQAWPQPVLTVNFGGVQRASRPDLALIGEQTAFSFYFPIRDSVLNALKSGGPIRASFNGKVMNFPVAPMEMRNEFSSKCAGLVPEGMRAD